MTQSGGRIQCPRCKANNFDSVATCFKCSAPLNANAMHTAVAPVNMSPVPSAYAERSPMPLTPSPLSGVPSLPLAYPAPTGDRGVARRAAVLLALTFPWFGLPIGWAFMMIEDERRQAIGRLCVMWSLVALVFHILLSFVLMQSLAPYMAMALNITKAAAQGKAQGAASPFGMPGG